MGAAARVDQGVRTVLGERRVVPAAAQVVAGVVVGGAGDPGRDRAARGVVEEDEELLPATASTARAKMPNGRPAMRMAGV